MPMASPFVSSPPRTKNVVDRPFDADSRPLEAVVGQNNVDQIFCQYHEYQLLGLPPEPGTPLFDPSTLSINGSLRNFHCRLHRLCRLQNKRKLHLAGSQRGRQLSSRRRKNVVDDPRVDIFPIATFERVLPTYLLRCR